MSEKMKLHKHGKKTAISFFVTLCIIGGLSGCSNTSSDADLSHTSEISYETESNESTAKSITTTEQIKESTPETSMDTEIPIETETSTTNGGKIISSELFEEVYVPYANREKPFLFNAVMTYAQSVDYDTEITEPTEDIVGSIKFIDNNGDYVYFSFLPINGIETISAISYFQSASNSEVSLNNYSSDGSQEHDEFNTHIIGEQSIKVSGIEDQRIFLFSK